MTCFVISQSEQICKWGIKYVHSMTTDHAGSTCAPTTHIASLTKIGHCVLIRERRFTFWCWWETYILHIHPSIATYIHTYRQRDKWKLSGHSSRAGGPQLHTHTHTHKKITWILCNFTPNDPPFLDLSPNDPFLCKKIVTDSLLIWCVGRYTPVTFTLECRPH